MKFGHLGIAAKDFNKSREFYKNALPAAGLPVVHDSEKQIRFGVDGTTMFYINAQGIPPNPVHIAFEADTREQIDAFYKAALAAGGKDNGAPGVRKDYSPTYYAAFVIDPDGHNVEMVCRK